MPKADTVTAEPEVGHQLIAASLAHGMVAKFAPPTFEQFAVKFYYSSPSHENMTLIRTYEDGRSGLHAVCCKAYRALLYSLKNGPDAMTQQAISDYEVK